MTREWKIGFTGTREGLAHRQIAHLFAELQTDFSDPTEFHHGGCMGADVQAAVAVRREFPACRIVCHPGPDGDPCQRLSGVDDERREPKTHFARNRDIVDEADELFACPQYQTPIAKDTRGGTAYTVNYARKLGKPLRIIWPDGNVTRESGKPEGS